VVESLVLSAQQDQARRAEGFLRENLNAMAVKLGQMQAQLVRLDALGSACRGWRGSSRRSSGSAKFRAGGCRFDLVPAA